MRDPRALREAKLELLREAIHESCGFIRLHAETCQLNAEAGDDTGAIYSLGRNDLRAIRDEAAAEPPPPQARRRYEARIVVSSARMPYGRTRAFRLSHDELDELIAVAMRIEGRRA